MDWSVLFSLFPQRFNLLAAFHYLLFASAPLLSSFCKLYLITIKFATSSNIYVSYYNFYIRVYNGHSTNGLELFSFNTTLLLLNKKLNLVPSISSTTEKINLKSAELDVAKLHKGITSAFPASKSQLGIIKYAQGALESILQMLSRML